MINALLQGLLKVVFFVIRSILNIILLPLTILVGTLFPNIDNYFSYFNTFFNNYVLKYLAFMREVFFNITGINRDLMAIVFTIPLTYLTFSILNTSITFLISIYRLYKTGKDS